MALLIASSQGGSVFTFLKMSKNPELSKKNVMVKSNPSANNEEIDLLALIRTLLLAWKTILGVIIVCIGLAIGIALQLPEVFKAETLLAPI